MADIQGDIDVCLYQFCEVRAMHGQRRNNLAENNNPNKINPYVKHNSVWVQNLRRDDAMGVLVMKRKHSGSSSLLLLSLFLS